MKKNFTLLFVSTIIVANLHAQFAKGDVLFGPSVSFGFSQSDYQSQSSGIDVSKNSNLSLGASIGRIKMQSTNKGIGVKLQARYSNFSGEQTSSSGVVYTSKLNTTNLGLAVFARKFYRISSQFNFYADAGGASSVGFGKGKYANTPVTPTNNYNQNLTNFSIGGYITPGFTYRLKKSLLLDIAFNNLVVAQYVYEKSKVDAPAASMYNNSYSNSNFQLNTAFSLGNIFNNFSIGLNWVL